MRKDGFCWNKLTNRRIKSCIVMHTFGLAGRVHELREICNLHNIILIEDAAESLGTFIGKTHTGTIADIGIMSFNGNKIITTGGGGMILTPEKKDLGEKFRHITTTAKVNHEWHFDHDEIGFNYRMPNLNAALGVAQMKKLKTFFSNKEKYCLQLSKMG